MSQPLAKSTFLSGKSTKVALFYGALALVAMIWFTPVITLVITALKDAGDFAVNGAFSLPKSIRWSNFSEAWDAGVKNYFWNSVIVTGIKVPLGILIESLAAFALTHMHFKWANQVFTYILIGLIVPIQMTLVPLTLLMNALNLIDTLHGLILLYLGFGVPFGRYFVSGMGGAVK
jgi:raffinose/stachyose/melibiose transport system permease protein